MIWGSVVLRKIVSYGFRYHGFPVYGIFMSECFAATFSHPELTLTAFSKLKPMSIIHIACYVALDQRLGSLGKRLYASHNPWPSMLHQWLHFPFQDLRHRRHARKLGCGTIAPSPTKSLWQPPIAASLAPCLLYHAVRLADVPCICCFVQFPWQRSAT